MKRSYVTFAAFSLVAVLGACGEKKTAQPPASGEMEAGTPMTQQGEMPMMKAEQAPMPGAAAPTAGKAAKGEGEVTAVQKK